MPDPDGGGVVNAGPAGAFAAVLLGMAVLVWPGRFSTRAGTVADHVGARLDVRPDVRTDVAAVDDPGPASSVPGPSVWQQDPVDLYRRWRLRRRPGDLLDDVLDLLRGIGPGLGAGLTPSRAIELAASSTLGVERVQVARQTHERRAGRLTGADTPRRRPWWSGRVSRHERRGPAGADIDQLVGALLDASDRAAPTSPVWGDWATRSASPELALVAAAWRLSETTGAPLASAVDRAVRGLLDARSRRSKVAVAVAGPRATVSVLTLLPLTGPLFGLACGIDPATLYLGSPIATLSVVLGIFLVWVGRVWCTRMVRRAVRP